MFEWQELDDNERFLCLKVVSVISKTNGYELINSLIYWERCWISDTKMNKRGNLHVFRDLLGRLVAIKL